MNMKHFETRKWISLTGLLCVAVWTACGEDGATPATSAAGDDTASAYEALSTRLQACEEQEDSCTTAAAGNPALIMNCQTQAAACQQKTEAAADHARENLSRDTHACWKRCRHGDDDAGMTSEDDGGTEDMHGCIERHTPRLPRCVLGFLSCLHDAGSLRRREVSRDELGACIEEADTCFRDEFAERRAERRGRGRGESDHGGKAGTGAAGTGAVSPAAAGSGGSAGGKSSGGWRERGGENRGRR
jgi:hypothetical protein